MTNVDGENWLYVFAEQYGEKTGLPHGTRKEPVFSVPVIYS